MQTAVVYFIKANIVLSLLYGFYWLLLKNEKHFKLNRFILIACVVVSLLLPFAPGNIGLFKGLQSAGYLPKTVAAVFSQGNYGQSLPAAAGNGAVVQAGESAAGRSLPIFNIACIVYLFVSFILLMGFIWQLLALQRLVATNIRQRHNGISYLKHNKELSPFSFFNHLVINEGQYTPEEYQQIIAHEKAHIKQWHTVDILLAEIMAIMFWVNPLVYTLKRSVKLNLEYIADAEALQTGIDKKAYQLNILNRCLTTGEYLLTNLFTSSKIKLRIKMMNTQKPGGRAWYKYAVVLPVLFAAWFVINPINAQPLPAKQAAAASETTDGSYKFERLYVVINANTNKELLAAITKKLAAWGVDFERISEHFSNDHLSDISVKFSVQGAFSGAVSSDSQDGKLAKPIIFYYEPGTGFHVSTGLVPNDMTEEGKKIVTNNLNGVMMINKDGRDLSGSCRWD